MSTTLGASPLAAFIRDLSAWRRGQAQKFPDDPRNRRSADALEELALEIERPRPGDPVLVELERLDVYDGAGAVHLGSSAWRLVSRYGFDRRPDVRAFLQLLLSAVAEDRKSIGSGAWSIGAFNRWRYEYPRDSSATYQGEIVDVIEAVVRAEGTPQFQQRPDGSLDVAPPRQFDPKTTSFKIRSHASSPQSAVWVDGADMGNVRLGVAPPPEPIDARWPASQLDGDDTYRWESAPREPGVCAKFELTLRDAAGAEGHHYKVEGSFLVDVCVRVEPLAALATSRWIRVVRCALPQGVTTREARGIAVRAYIERCARQGRTPSGWTLEIEPNYWGGMAFDQLALIAGEPGVIGREAQKELHARGYFYDSLTGRWIEDRPDLSIRVPSAPIKRGQPIPWGQTGPDKQLLAPPRELWRFLERAYRDRSYLRHGGKTWQISRFSIGDPPDAMELVEAAPPPGVRPLDFDRAGSWHPMTRDDLEHERVRCAACGATITRADAVPLNAATGEPGAAVTCPSCENHWLALLDRH